MTKTIRLTMAQAVAHFMKNQMTIVDGRKVPIFGGVWAIFGHGNVVGMGEALYQVREELPTWRAHNEQGMALSAVAYAKANFRQRFQAVTTSIGPGALNMVTAAGVAMVNRLPVLFLPGDVFANRAPDPVLQQIEDFNDGTVTVNDAFRCVSRYFDRITRPEQIVPALRRTMQVLTDPVDCGPVTLSLCQDVQGEAFDCPVDFLKETVWTFRRPRADEGELDAAIQAIKDAKKPIIIAGGGVLYSQATTELAHIIEHHKIPVTVTQAGKSAVPDSHPLMMGSVGVAGSSASVPLCEDADLVICVGTRMGDFTTGSWAMFKNPDVRFLGINTQIFDAGKRGGIPVIGDARETLKEIRAGLGNHVTPAGYAEHAMRLKAEWMKAADAALAPTNVELPSDAQVIGAVARVFESENTILVGAAGGLPGELHKLWPAKAPGSYHMEYGFSCMGYEIAGGVGVKMARPDADVVVMLGDGSYMMMNSELSTSIMLGQKLTVVVLDNRGFGCINRLQMGTGNANFNNLLKDAKLEVMPEIDFRMHAASMGAHAVKVSSITELETALAETRRIDRTCVIVIDTDPLHTTKVGGSWWDVGVPEISPREEVTKAHARFVEARKNQI